jgi:hypothetical protein
MCLIYCLCPITTLPAHKIMSGYAFGGKAALTSDFLSTFIMAFLGISVSSVVSYDPSASK